MNRRTLVALAIAFGGAVLLSFTEAPARTIWPPLAALLVIATTRHALAGLLAGAFAGALMLAGGDPWQAYLGLFADHLAPSLRSSWKVGAVAFTLVLGGFAAVLERGGGFAALVQRWVRPGPGAARRLETAATGLGLVCFFDGLANSMVVGRVCREIGDRCGVPRVKLAYIVDSTSSAVACVALVSTWIAFQLSMIAESFAMAGRPANPYAVFLHSLPYNFHCWFTIILLFVAVRARFHPGPMGAYERAALAGRAGLQAASAEVDGQGLSRGTFGSAARATLLPIGVLLATFLVGFVALGAPRPLWPLSREKGGWRPSGRTRARSSWCWLVLSPRWLPWPGTLAGRPGGAGRFRAPLPAASARWVGRSGSCLRPGCWAACSRRSARPGRSPHCWWPAVRWP
jgi:Na+/H+ antiporter NhaC